METRVRLPYEGSPRFIRGKFGQMVPATKRHFDPGTIRDFKGRPKRQVTDTKLVHRGRGLHGGSIIKTVVEHGRPRFKLGGIIKLPYIKWLVIDQVEAVKRGYFIARASDNHARVLPLPHGSFAGDADVMNAAERLALHHDAHALKLVAFVAQQDRFGWSGVWETRAVETCSRTLTWFKAWHAASAETRAKPRGRKHGPTGYAVKRQPTGRPRGRPRKETPDERTIRMDREAFLARFGAPPAAV